MEEESSQPSDPEPTPADVDWRDMPPSESADERRILLSFAAVLVTFKLVGLAIIVVFMLQAGYGDAIAFLAATHVPFIVVGLGILSFPVSAFLRRLRLRARRRHLIWAEWNVEELSGK